MSSRFDRIMDFPFDTGLVFAMTILALSIAVVKALEWVFSC